MKKTISLLLALVMALSLLPAAVWATEGAGDTAGETTEEAYDPFAGLTETAAKEFVETYVEYGKNENGPWVFLIDVQIDEGLIADKSLKQANTALDAYAKLEKSARSELDAVFLFTNEDNGYRVTFADLMSDYQAIYQNTVDPYKPFDKVTDAKAVEFADAYIDCGRWGDEY